MKRFLFVIILIVPFLSYSEDRWIRYSYSDNSESYVDSKKIKKTNVGYNVWTKMTNIQCKKDQKDDTCYLLTSIKINCENENAIIESIYKYNNAGDVVSANMNLNTKREAPPGSNAEILITTFCHDWNEN